jgi:hypothetical protein
MSTSRPILLALLFSLLLSGCATPLPVPKLEQQETSGIGISVKIRTPIGWSTEEPHVVYFIKLDDKGDIQQRTVIPSNYAKDGRVYLLNVAPGDYAAVAAWYSKQMPSAVPVQPGFSVSFNPAGAIAAGGWSTYFPKELIEQTRVSVGKGQFVFAGSYVLNTSVFGKEDPLQAHYAYEVISRGVKWLGSIREAKYDDTARTEFLIKAREDLAEGGWTAFIK